MNKQIQREDLRPYRIFGLPVLLTLSLIGIAGVALHLLMKMYF